MKMILDHIEMEARYAINSYSKNLVYRAIGMNDMAYMLQAISKEDWIRIGRQLIRDTLNNAEWIQQVAKIERGK